MMDQEGMVAAEAQQRVVVARRVERAATHAANLLHDMSSAQVASSSSSSSLENGDENGDDNKMYAQLDEARNSVLAACTSMTTPLVDDSEQEDNQGVMMDSHATFRAAYVDVMTQAFAQELEDMRQPPGRENASSSAVAVETKDDEPENTTVVMDVHALVDCLESGIHSWTPDERDLFLQSHADDDTNTMEDDNMVDDHNKDGQSLTPHERRRQLLGFASCVNKRT
mmetsp:Transcript_20430/g.37029  ORF Transcript_20430/g.37029 Transcript_20430/m.37029 type:complete len:226 (-) Transcript_20430:68-745(-)